MSFQDNVKKTVESIGAKFTAVVEGVKAHVAEVRAAQDQWNADANAYVAEHGIEKFEQAMKQPKNKL